MGGFLFVSGLREWSEEVLKLLGILDMFKEALHIEGADPLFFKRKEEQVSLAHE